MMPIRKGDGTGLSVPGFSEVRTGDGTVLWSAGADIPDSGGEHQWNLDEGDGTAISDYLGSLDGTLVSGTWATGDGVGGTHLSLSSEDGIDFGTASKSALSHIVNNATGTFSVWFKTTTTNDQFLFGNAFSSSTKSFNVLLRGGDYRFIYSNGSDITIATGGTITTGAWVNITGTCDGSTARVYAAEPPDYEVVEVGSGSALATVSGDLEGNNVHLGSIGNGGDFTGDIDATFTDPSGFSQSEIQSWVDATAEYYQ